MCSLFTTLSFLPITHEICSLFTTVIFLPIVTETCSLFIKAIFLLITTEMCSLFAKVIFLHITIRMCSFTPRWFFSNDHKNCVTFSSRRFFYMCSFFWFFYQPPTKCVPFNIMTVIFLPITTDISWTVSTFVCWLVRKSPLGKRNTSRSWLVENHRCERERIPVVMSRKIDVHYSEFSTNYITEMCSFWLRLVENLRRLKQNSFRWWLEEEHFAVNSTHFGGDGDLFLVKRKRSVVSGRQITAVKRKDNSVAISRKIALSKREIFLGRCNWYKPHRDEKGTYFGGDW